MQRVAPVVLVVVMVLLAAGCGSNKSSESTSTAGSESTSTADWADGVCSAITTWQTSITSSADSLKGGNLSKNSLQSAVDDMKSATDTLESDLKGLGKPDTQAGQQAKDSIDQLSSEVKTETDSIKTALDGASGLSGVLTATASISTTLKTMGDQVSATYTTLKGLDPKGELQTAFEQSSSCQQLSSSS